MHRELLHIPLPFADASLPIYSYGFMMMLAFVASLTLTYRRAKTAGMNPEIVLDLGLYSIVCGVIGARLAFLLTEYQPDPASTSPFLDYVAIWQGGLTFQGGLFLALAVCIWYLRSKQLPAAKMADIFAPGLALGIAIGRIGCFLNGCCWGRICSPDFATGVRFPEDSGAFLHLHRLFREGQLLPLLEKTGNQAALEHLRHADPDRIAEGIAMVPVHPTQLYTVAAMLVVFVLVLLVDRLPRRFDGMVMLAFLMLYSVVRFAVELVRDDTPLLFSIGTFPGLRQGQIMALATLLIAGGVFLRLWRRSTSQNATPRNPGA